MVYCTCMIGKLLCGSPGSSLVTMGLILLLSIVIIAFGASFGIRRCYVMTLQWMFEQDIQQPRASAGSPEFKMADVLSFCRRGVESIVDDDVTKRFSAQELDTWNLLTRSSYNFHNFSMRLSVLWGVGIFVRYGILLPLRLTLAVAGINLLFLFTAMVACLPNRELRVYLTEKVHAMCYHFCARSITAIVTYHNRENKPRGGSICVANHTTPIDVIILANDGCYSLVGQLHGGLMGMIQKAMVRSSPHIWFDRAQMKDRHLVAKRLGEHVADKTKQPILIFPEGTCINNTSVMMFKKGSFEIGCTVYPVAIKAGLFSGSFCTQPVLNITPSNTNACIPQYDPRFGDAFWNSSKFGLVSYLLRMMSSWAIVCSVWYLPPMNRQEEEDAVQFANRVKAAIAAQGGLEDLIWDGGLKRAKVKDTFREEQQQLYSKVLAGEEKERHEEKENYTN
ncbi:glycerol-3-phosphate acyltransferase 4-like isoform X2 [Dunckerocampus dactyliophorus]|uniref:glycerol-3-phosphate acyltransferase 4-like isoform X2 n=1 Tax=Dunckerocampus dactyliophorus TaxID=161453 RepID=UPI0024049125|nr:glycerol-3-phosphate acyltransferase 4-like isoform X2 [Dunckerocampus dactyliophorus]